MDGRLAVYLFPVSHEKTSFLPYWIVADGQLRSCICTELVFHEQQFFFILIFHDEFQLFLDQLLNEQLHELQVFRYG